MTLFLTSPMTVEATGPFQGISEIARAIDAPIIEATSGE